METNTGIFNTMFNKEMFAAVFNRGLFRAIIIIFAIGIALLPFTVISEDTVNVPDRSQFVTKTKPGDAYMKPQTINSLRSKLVSPADMGVPVSLIEKPSSNRDKIWNYLLNAGFSDAQAAGIMGNLKQEHGFQTSGNGLAQWMGGRHARLMGMKNPYSLKTQLDFLVKVELGGSYSHVAAQLKKCKSVDEATILFCNKYERPGIPAMGKRIAFAHETYNAYHKDKSSIKPILVVEGKVRGV
jgi:hypothetical protein